MRTCVVGLGRLGLAWALAAEVAGHSVTGLDVDPARVEAINGRRVNSSEPQLTELLGDPRCLLHATVDPAEALHGVEVSVIAVATPPRADGSLDHSAVIKAVVTIAGSADLAPGHVVVVKSTVSPGTISGPVRAAVELGAAAKGTAGPAVVYAPEFHAIGSIVHDIAHPYLLVVGGDEHWAIDRAIELEQSLVDAPVEVARLDPTAAEIVKLASNCFRTTKIAFANSLAQLCAAYGTDAAAVCDAVGADPYIGRRYLAPGLPFGGPCYPRDNPALAAAGTAVGVEVPLAAAVAHANELRYEELLSAALTAGPGAIGIVGVSFKDGVSELEGSPSLELARRLEQAGREVLIHDPRHASVDGRPTVTLEELVRVCSAVFVGAADAVLARAVGDELARHGAGPLVLDPCGLVTRSAANDVRAPWVPADAVPE